MSTEQKIVGAVNPEIIEVREQLASQLIEQHGKTDAIKALAYLAGYNDVPPSIMDFINNPYYLGDMIGPKLFPVWADELRQIYPDPFYAPYLEVCLSGSIGSGKTTAAMCGISYDVMRLLLMRDPHEQYGLIKSTKIVVALVNATLGLAGGVLYDQFTQWINTSPFFKLQISKNAGKTLLPNNIDITVGSRHGHVAGQAVFSALLSELNDQKRVAKQAYENYNHVRTRLKSRFHEVTNFPGRIWLDSSKGDEFAFLEDHIKRAATDVTAKVCSYPIWVAQEHKNDYSGKRFKVFIGDKVRDPFIVQNAAQLKRLNKLNVISVPIEYLHDFTFDILRALQDLAGVGTWSTYKFFSSVDPINDSLMRKNPVSKEVIQLEFFNRDQSLIRYLTDLPEMLVNRQPRFIHLDIGIKNDRSGIASSRLAGNVKVRRIDKHTGLIFETRSPIYYTDFVMAIECVPGQEVPIYKLQQFMEDLRKRGYPIGGVSTDGYQSTNLRQNLTLKGFETELISVDRTTDPYTHFRDILLEGRYNGVQHEILSNELKSLIEVGGKVDHPASKGSSKDVADGVAGSVWHVYQNMLKNGAEIDTEEIVKGLRARGGNANTNSLYAQIANQGTVVRNSPLNR